jgi:hypothetical protein
MQQCEADVVVVVVVPVDECSHDLARHSSFRDGLN